MTQHDMDPELETFFAAGRAKAPQPSDDFLARLQADADAAVPKPDTVSTPKPEPAFGWLKGFLTASGLSGAAVLGVWIGLVSPETVTDLAGLTDDTVALYTFLPGADLTALSE